MIAPRHKPLLHEQLVRFKVYHEQHPDWGPMHIVLDDNNVNDASADFCIQYAIKSGDAEGEALARILRTMSKSQRWSLPAKLAKLTR